MPHNATNVLHVKGEGTMAIYLSPHQSVTKSPHESPLSKGILPFFNKQLLKNGKNVPMSS